MPGWDARRGASANASRAGAILFPEIAGWRYGMSRRPALISQDWLTIQHTMWNYVGLIRSENKRAQSRHAGLART